MYFLKHPSRSIFALQKSNLPITSIFKLQPKSHNPSLPKLTTTANRDTCKTREGQRPRCPYGGESRAAGMLPLPFRRFCKHLNKQCSLLRGDEICYAGNKKAHRFRRAKVYVLCISYLSKRSMSQPRIHRQTDSTLGWNNPNSTFKNQPDTHRNFIP